MATRSESPGGSRRWTTDLPAKSVAPSPDGAADRAGLRCAHCGARSGRRSVTAFLYAEPPSTAGPNGSPTER